MPPNFTHHMAMSCNILKKIYLCSKKLSNNVILFVSLWVGRFFLEHKRLILIFLTKAGQQLSVVVSHAVRTWRELLANWRFRGLFRPDYFTQHITQPVTIRDIFVFKNLKQIKSNLQKTPFK